MADADSLLLALEAIQTHPSHGFVIVGAEAAKNYYAQFVPDGPDGLTAEIVGNANLQPSDQLEPEQQAAMRARGWRGDGEENWVQTWAGVDGARARQEVALAVLGALDEVYGADGTLRVRLALGGPDGRAKVAALRNEGVEPLVAHGKRFVIALVLAIALLLLAVLFLLA